MDDTNNRLEYLCGKLSGRNRVLGKTNQQIAPNNSVLTEHTIGQNEIRQNDISSAEAEGISPERHLNSVDHGQEISNLRPESVKDPKSNNAEFQNARDSAPDRESNVNNIGPDLNSLRSRTNITQRYHSEGILQNSLQRNSQYGSIQSTNKSIQKKFKKMKMAFSEFYINLLMLKNYQEINVEGFRKIMKKHDKLLKSNEGRAWITNTLKASEFYKKSEVEKLIKEVENIFTVQLESGDRRRAMAQLRYSSNLAKPNPRVAFRIGLYLGAIIIMAILSILLVIFTPIDYPSGLAIKLFRGTFLITIFFGLIGFNVYGWRKAHVNHVLIFEINPRDYLSALHFWELFGIFGIIWTGTLLVYMLCPVIGLNEFIPPLTPPFLLLLFLITPLNIFHLSSRKWFINKLFRLFCQIFLIFSVSFVDGWLGDQLVSMTAAITDLEFTICFYTTEFFGNKTYMEPINANTSIGSCNSIQYGIVPIVSSLPNIIRLLQNVRRAMDTGQYILFVNSGKYAASMSITLFSSLYTVFHGTFLRVLWTASLIISTLYSYIWDIKMDMGLFDSKTCKCGSHNAFLREELIYKPKIKYYLMIVGDFFLRLGWGINFTVGQMDLPISFDVVKAVTSTLEMIRRCLWNFFRVENEHIRNCQQYIAVRNIRVVTILPNSNENNS